MHNKSSEVCIKTRSTPASLPFRGQVTKPTTVKWSIQSLSEIQTHCGGFKSRSEPEFFSGLCSRSVTAVLVLMTIITQLLLWTKLISQTSVFMRSILKTLLSPGKEHQTVITHNTNRHCLVHFYACVEQP